MTMNEQLVKEILAKYGVKKYDLSLLKLAFTHSSYANEHNLKSNERLEFLGDAVLQLLMTHYIYEKFPNVPEGTLTKLRATFVCEDANQGYAKELGIEKLILLGHGEEQSGARKRPAILNDTFEAFIGAIYLGSGLDDVKRILDVVVFPDITSAEPKPFVDYKSQLQEYIQAESRSILVYRLDDVDGPPHKRVFKMSAVLDGIKLGSGIGASKKDAEQQAAKEALSKMAKN